MAAASEADWSAEYLAPVLAVKTVAGIDEAVDHIARYGTGHTEAIIAEDETAAEAFLARVDSAIVMWNASTQFADGGEFGFGAEIGNRHRQAARARPGRARAAHQLQICGAGQGAR
jgi:glutamate-5-semialdehyde dehydrogenase